MKKNKLFVSITTIRVYSYDTDAATADVAFDEYLNDSTNKSKFVERFSTPMEIYDFKPNIKKTDVDLT